MTSSPPSVSRLRNWLKSASLISLSWSTTVFFVIGVGLLLGFGDRVGEGGSGMSAGVFHRFLLGWGRREWVGGYRLIVFDRDRFLGVRYFRYSFGVGDGVESPSFP